MNMAKITLHNNTGVAAADFSPARAWLSYPLNHNPECSAWALDRIYRRARSLYANSPQVRYAVQTLTTMAGTITPRPCSGDEEWDKAAREAFLRRAQNPALFDACGQMTFQQAQQWIERRAIIDGDNLTVLTGARDGGGSIQLYAAPQITDNGEYNGGYNTGVIMGQGGRVKAYSVYDYESKKPVTIAANRAILYRHGAEPYTARGASELLAAITTA